MRTRGVYRVTSRGILAHLLPGALLVVVGWVADFGGSVDGSGDGQSTGMNGEGATCVPGRGLGQPDSGSKPFFSGDLCGDGSLGLPGPQGDFLLD